VTIREHQKRFLTTRASLYSRYRIRQFIRQAASPLHNRTSDVKSPAAHAYVAIFELA